MSDTKRRWTKGLAVMHQRQRSREAQERVPGKPGRPAARRMVHEALHSALAGFGEKSPA